MDLLPAGTLAEVIIIVREIKTSQTSGGRYLDLELAINGGEYDRRRVFSVIVDPWDARSSEGGKGMSQASLARIFEYMGVFIPGDEASYAIFPDEDTTPGECIQKCAMMINGKKAGVCIGVQKGKDGYADKNSIKEWLSPNPQSGGYKGYQRLVNGETGGTPVAPRLGATQPAPATQAPLGFRAPAQTGMQTPSFLAKK